MKGKGEGGQRIAGQVGADVLAPTWHERTVRLVGAPVVEDAPSGRKGHRMQQLGDHRPQLATDVGVGVSETRGSPLDAPAMGFVAQHSQRSMRGQRLEDKVS